MVAFIDNLIAKAVALKEKVFKKKDGNKSVETEESAAPVTDDAAPVIPETAVEEPVAAEPAAETEAAPAV